jgi:uncharacterized RDD family membrane protein YckC
MTFCQFCGSSAVSDTQVATAQTAPQLYGISGYAHAAPEWPRSAVVYGSFLARVGAKLIDSFILWIGSIAALVILSPLFGGGDGGALLLLLAMISITWLYSALLESSEWQATLGKKACGLVVTDMHGDRITFARASGRFFASYFSGFILGIGYLMAAFTEKKQTLHDMIAETLVKKR